MTSEVTPVLTATGDAEGETRKAPTQSTGPVMLSTMDRETEGPQSGGLSCSPTPSITSEVEGAKKGDVKAALTSEESCSASVREQKGKDPGEEVTETERNQSQEPGGAKGGQSQEPGVDKEGLSQEPGGVKGGLSQEPVGTEEGLSQEPLGTEEGLSQEPGGAKRGLSHEPGGTKEGLSQESAETEEDLSQEPMGVREFLGVGESVELGHDLNQKPAGVEEGLSWEPKGAIGSLIQELGEAGEDLTREPLGFRKDANGLDKQRLDKESAEGRKLEQELGDSQSVTTAFTIAAGSFLSVVDVIKTDSAPAASSNEGRNQQDATWPSQQGEEAMFPDSARTPIATCNSEAAAPVGREQWEGPSVSSAGGVEDNIAWEEQAVDRENLLESEKQATVIRSPAPPSYSQFKCLEPQESQETMALENGDQSETRSDSRVSTHFSSASTLELPPTSETPIEREIRLSMEREEVLRKERGIAPSLGSQQYVEVRMKPILSQFLPTTPTLPKEKDRQLAGAQMQRDILLESQREEDLVLLGKVRGLYDRGIAQELQEKRLLFEQKQDVLALEPIALKRLSGGFSTESLPPKTPEGKKGPSYAEANGTNLIVLEHSTLEQTTLSSSFPVATKTQVSDAGNPSFSLQGTVESIQRNPFFQLRSKSPQSLLEQEIREVRERENELRMLRHNLYGLQPLDNSNQDQHLAEGEQPTSNSSFSETLSFGKLDVTWPPPRATDNMNGKMPEQEERGAGSLRQKSTLLQRWEAGMVSAHPPQDDE